MNYLVSRHPGAIAWCQRQSLAIDAILPHLDPALICAGDRVIGTLPLPMVAEVQRRGARYLHLSVSVPSELRGQELSADQLDKLGASLTEYQVHALL
ncbi:CRISPR-associated protein Csx16 [Shewanella sp. LC6]|uniref:CRISPR-associated protein Csx16 n=1 Tax=unclassified Shewanella TaxID=196818 RepID=UPI00112E3642|nr:MULTISPECIES: CRISPR-associated protein Csx16 [unclassified Shewanella]QQK58052.1 CRISPR-associated protein Csx16 [Shewanella sp. LC6]TPE64764.1 CRISPR-associated protein Csx16 [Shewanella sp. LC2]